MDRQEAPRIDRTVWIVSALWMLTSLAACGDVPAPTTTTATSNPPTNTSSSITSTIERYLAGVQAGPEDVDPLPDLTDHERRVLADRDRVTTDQNGEGWLRIQNCMLIYLFQASRFTKASCPRSAFVSGNVSCVRVGTAGFNNSCSNRVIIQTNSAQIILNGTWLAVTYLEAQHLTLVIVLDGTVSVEPALDSVAVPWTLGAGISVREQHFLFTTPDDVPHGPIAGLQPRQVYPLSELPPLIQELGLDPWVQRIRERATVRDGIAFPEFPSPVPQATDTPIATRTGSEAPTDTARVPAHTPTHTVAIRTRTRIPTVLVSTDTPTRRPSPPIRTATYTPSLSTHTPTHTVVPTRTNTPVGPISEARCVTFDSLPRGETYGVGDKFAEAGTAMYAIPFIGSNGTPSPPGKVSVISSGETGGSNHYLRLNNISIDFSFPEAPNSLSLRFAEFKGNINVRVNGQLANVNDLSELNQTKLGGVEVRADTNDNIPRTSAESGSQGVLTLTGKVRSFAIGGQELLIDDVCLPK